MKIKYLLFLCAMLFVLSCKKEKPEEPVVPPVISPQDSSGVVFNPSEVPYTNLSTYNFFEGNLADLNPVAGVLPYDVITPLFSNYAHKKRFIWMPVGSSATFENGNSSLNFPDGTILIKNFYYENVLPDNQTKLIETRLMYRIDGVWLFANYVWNSDQTEAIFDNQGSNVPIDWIDENNVTKNVDYRIPNVLECNTCHKSYNTTTPIGTKPQDLNRDFNYADGVFNQMVKWQQVGYLSGNVPTDYQTTVAWDNPSEDLTERVRSYLDMNCSHCHMDGGHCDYRSMRFPFIQTTDPANMGVCIEPDDVVGDQFTHIISSGNVDKSVLHLRLNTTEQTLRMPLLGRTIVHEEAVQLIEDYINALDTPCE
jgi:uncharacterized repeat protein (TIGR03806 family)